jgi:hypothetical protein
MDLSLDLNDFMIVCGRLGLLNWDEWREEERAFAGEFSFDIARVRVQLEMSASFAPHVFS